MLKIIVNIVKEGDPQDSIGKNVYHLTFNLGT
jgi:hypothetical protein